MTRAAQIEDFLASAGWPGADHVTLAEDASFRRYERVTRPGERAVLMDAPPDREDVRPFMKIAKQLSALGFSAPRLLAEDVGAGFLLLEDMGDATFSRLMDAGEAAAPLYSLATDVLIDLHGTPAVNVVPPGTPVYDDALMLTEAMLLTEWYLPAVAGEETQGSAEAAYRAVWADLLPLARHVPDTLVLRDFHVDNLMRIAGRDGTAACGLLDFQDAVEGPVSYDFISLVEDARRDVDDGLRAGMRARYLAAFPALDPAAFDLSCVILGAQRHCKVLGIFTRLRDRDGKDDYLHHVPRLWRLLERAAEHPSLAPLKSWLDTHIPARMRIAPPARGEI
ncbi:MAG: aminoglycoside/choline kinase family phosphotransferase [Paracoccaceae bacterium]|jgi:aminoglycoside/choline kinase family phosphotransferase